MNAFACAALTIFKLRLRATKEAPIPSRTGASWQVAMGLGVWSVASAALVAPARSQEPDTATFTLSGEILDAWTGSALVAAVIKIPPLRRFALTDVHGRFRLPDIPPGTWDIVVEQLGYHTVDGSATVTRGNGLIVRLIPDPVEMEGFRVRSFGQQLLGRRRQRFPFRVTTISEATIRRSINGDLAHIFRMNARSAVTTCPTEEGEVGWGAFGCIARRGKLRRIGVFLDEAPLPEGMVQLSAFPASDVHSMDWIPATAQLRVYTKWFVKHLDRGNTRLAPLIW